MFKTGTKELEWRGRRILESTTVPVEVISQGDALSLHVLRDFTHTKNEDYLTEKDRTGKFVLFVRGSRYAKLEGIKLASVDESPRLNIEVMPYSMLIALIRTNAEDAPLTKPELDTHPAYRARLEA